MVPIREPDGQLQQSSNHYCVVQCASARRVDPRDELSDLAQTRGQNSQSRRKGADQRKMTDPAISAFLGNTAMGVNLLGHSATVLGTDEAIAPWRE
jgi:hypothetical protein